LKEVKNEGTGAAFIVLEPNYRIYAYTNSNLRISILSLFAKFNYRLPNLVAGVITRESFRIALSKGITAEQVVMDFKSFLVDIVLGDSLLRT
jgi:hypothetical protein